MTLTEAYIKGTCSSVDDVCDLVEKFAVDKQCVVSYSLNDKSLWIGYLTRNTVRNKGKLKKTRAPWRELRMTVTLSCE